jgi:hypothetical protein
MATAMLSSRRQIRATIDASSSFRSCRSPLEVARSIKSCTADDANTRAALVSPLLQPAFEGQEEVHGLTLDTQRLAGGGEKVEARGLAEESLG